MHGFRSAFSDWAHETTGASNHVIELSLAHTIGNLEWTDQQHASEEPANIREGRDAV